MTTPRTGSTRADETFYRLKFDILNGQFAPGAKLAFVELGARYSVSTGVLREVLPRLVGEGLATSEPQIGFKVVSVSRPDLEQLTSAREALEGLVIVEAVNNGDLQWESSVVAAHHALARTPHVVESGGINPDWIAAHEQFHLALLAGCGNSYLVDSARRLRTIAQVYRYWSKEQAELAKRDVAAEHQAIADAVVHREAEECARLTRHHIRLTTDLLLRGEREPVP